MRSTLAADTLDTHMRAGRVDRPTADGTRTRISWARHCARRISLDIAGIPPEHELDLSTLVTFALGQAGHEIIQAALVDRLGAQTEVRCTFRPDHDLSGNADAVYTDAGRVVVAEIKTMSAYGFDIATGACPSWDEPDGPKIEHITQAALYAVALGADAIHLIYLRKEHGDIAEWIYRRDEPLPAHDNNTPAGLASDELGRLDGICTLADRHEIARPVIPGPADGTRILVTDPTSDAAPWQCRYCPHARLCSSLGTGRVAVDRIETPA